MNWKFTEPLKSEKLISEYEEKITAVIPKRNSFTHKKTIADGKECSTICFLSVKMIQVRFGGIMIGEGSSGIGSDTPTVK